MSDRWRRVTRARPCPICGRPKWCLLSSDGNAAICARTVSPKRAGEAGYLHILRNDGSRHHSLSVRTIGPLSNRSSAINFEGLARRFYMVGNRALLAAVLTLTSESLDRLRVGWATEKELQAVGTKCCGRGCWAFPMSGPNGETLGIRLRSPDGFKYCISGGAEGLFLPFDLPANGQLLICEGATDTAAMLDLGFAAVGRPSCQGGTRLLVQLVRSRPPTDIVVVEDADAPGRAGASALASALAVHARHIRIIAPPAGLKDVRAWVQAGATAADVKAAIDAVPTRKLSIRRREVVTHGR